MIRCGRICQAKDMKAPMETCFALVDTSLGAIGIAWTDRGLGRLELPGRDREATMRRLLRSLGDAAEAPPPDSLAPFVEKLKSYAGGVQVDFAGVATDLEGIGRFRSAVYDALLRTGYGETTTYGELAAAAGFPGAARETGTALGQNPVPLVVPCHRVLAAGGALGGFSAPGGAATKERLLIMEGVRRLAPETKQVSFAF